MAILGVMLAILGHFSRFSPDDHLDTCFSDQQDFTESTLVLYIPRYSIIRLNFFNPPGPEKCRKYNSQKWPFFANLEGPICLSGTPWMNFQEHLRKVGFLVSLKFKSKNTHPRFRTFGKKIRCVLIFQAIYIFSNRCVMCKYCAPDWRIWCHMQDWKDYTTMEEGNIRNMQFRDTGFESSISETNR